MAWLAMRQGGRPGLAGWVAASFLAAVVADGVYLRGALLEAPSAIGVSAAFYILAAACLVVAAGGAARRERSTSRARASCAPAPGSRSCRSCSWCRCS